MHKYLTMTEAARLAPGSPHMASVWRWARKGLKTRSGGRIRLEHIRAGGKIFTTEAALQEFFRAVTEADAPHFAAETSSANEKPRSQTERDKSIDRASKTLAGAGIL